MQVSRHGTSLEPVEHVKTALRIDRTCVRDGQHALRMTVESDTVSPLTQSLQMDITRG